MGVVTSLQRRCWLDVAVAMVDAVSRLGSHGSGKHTRASAGRRSKVQATVYAAQR